MWDRGNPYIYTPIYLDACPGFLSEAAIVFTVIVCQKHYNAKVTSMPN
jgi:hypothetical protein